MMIILVRSSFAPMYSSSMFAESADELKYQLVMDILNRNNVPSMQIYARLNTDTLFGMMHDAGALSNASSMLPQDVIARCVEMEGAWTRSFIEATKNATIACPAPLPPQHTIVPMRQTEPMRRAPKVDASRRSAYSMSSSASWLRRPPPLNDSGIRGKPAERAAGPRVIPVDARDMPAPKRRGAVSGRSSSRTLSLI
jgi:hypothetical protein